MWNSEEERGQNLCQSVLRLAHEPDHFHKLALEVFRFQSENNPIYRKYIHQLARPIDGIQSLEEIPFLPISLFKKYPIKTGEWISEATFSSSGTTGNNPGKHHIKSISFYYQLAISIFEKRFGPLNQFRIIALLPHYLENPNSSLISMVQAFGLYSGEPALFFGMDFNALQKELNRNQNRQVLIFSVSFALMELVEKMPLDLSAFLVIETGGMKGLRKEMPKQEIVDILINKLNIKNLYSEYGMTELQSQAYANPLHFDNSFSFRPMVREMEDPFEVRKKGRGLANLVDLGNVFTCSFIASDDLIEISEDGRFQILGRALGSELRGCNLLFA